MAMHSRVLAALQQHQEEATAIQANLNAVATFDSAQLRQDLTGALEVRLLACCYVYGAGPSIYRARLLDLT